MKQQRLKFTFNKLVWLSIYFFLLMSQVVLATDYRPYPQTTFITLSDLHFFDPVLGTGGEAFKKYLTKDRKLLTEAKELLEVALEETADINADFVIISGDLTKDGEKHNHKILARKLRALKQSGKKVYVVPGNHDIWNADSVRFVGDHTESIPTISAADFETIYQDFGYGDALERDQTSLSYLAEPVPGLWVLALDTAKWRENKLDHHPLVTGIIYEETVAWIKTVLQRAKEKQKAVIVFMHHALLEHYPFNLKFYPEYLIDNHEVVKEIFSKAGVQLVFTGHFHAQDVTGQKVETTGKIIYDIETGSLVTAPCPYRIVQLTANQQVKIESRFIQRIPSRTEGFPKYAADFVYEGTKKLADAALKDLWVGEEDRQIINPLVSRAFSTHIKGDEKIEDYVLEYDDAGTWGSFIMFMRKKLLKAWYTDLPPADNNLVIDLDN